jgi:hypothetical protein
MVIQIQHLTRQKVIANLSETEINRKSASEEKSSKQIEGKKTKRKPIPNRKAAVTILIVTTIFVLTSTISVAVWLVVYRTHLGREDKIKILSWTELGMIYICSSTPHLLCSTLTALTLLMRSSKMQTGLKETLKKTTKSLKITS